MRLGAIDLQPGDEKFKWFDRNPVLGDGGEHTANCERNSIRNGLTNKEENRHWVATDSDSARRQSSLASLIKGKPDFVPGLRFSLLM